MRLLELSPVQQRKVRTLAKYSNTVEYQIRTTLDSSGIAKLKAELNSLQNLTKTKGAQGLLDQSQVNKTLADINRVKNALNQAFNPKLGMVSNKSLFNSIGKDLNGIYNSFSQLGPQGVRAFSQVYGQIGKIDLGMKQISSTSDKIMNTFGNTFRWGIIASAFSGIMNSIHQSVQYVKDLDKSLTNIQMVTASSRDAMNDFAVQANEAAKRLGGTTVQMTNATEVFIRQGHSLQTSTQLGEYAVHLANVSGQDSATASDEITAYMNAFHISVDDIGNAVSKWAAVANNAAVSVEELSVASQKAAAVATTVGVDMDQFAAHIAAIEATTREAPENIGNGLKTLYSRIADISLGETLEDGVNMGSFAKAIEKVGVEVLDDAGKLRDAGDIIQDLMGVWQDLDQTQRAALAKTVAGRFQLARFEALMNSADIYEKSLKTSQFETGTDVYDRMQETYRDSMEGRLNALSATIEGIFTKAFNTDDFYGMIDAATKLAETFDNLVQAMGGGNQAILAFSAIITKVFANNIGRGISNMISNQQTKNQVAENKQFAMQQAQAQLAGKGLNINNKDVMALANNNANILQYAPSMNNEQIEKSNGLFERQMGLFKQLSAAEETYTQTSNAVKSVLMQMGMSAEDVDKNLIELVRAIQSGGIESEITAEKLKNFGFEQITDKIKSTQNSVSNFINALEKAKVSGEGFDTIITGAEKLQNVLAEVAEKAGLTGEDFKLVEETILSLDDVINGNIEDFERLENSLRGINVVIEQSAKGINALRETLTINADVLAQQKAQVDALRIGYEQTLAEGRGMAQGLQMQNLVSGFANVASASMTAVFAMQSFVNIFKIIGNEDLDPFEKLEQLTMNIAMTAAMGIPAITQMKGAFQSISTELTAMTANFWAKNAAEATAITLMEQEAKEGGVLTAQQLLQIANKAELTEAEIGALAAKKGYILAIKEENAAQTVNNTIKTKSTATTLTAIAAEKLSGTVYSKTVGKIGLLIAARLGLITAENAEAVALGNLTAAEIAAAGAGTILLATILPIVAAIGAVALILKVSYDAWNADANAMANAAKVAEEANTKWKETKETVENLTSALKELNEVSDAIDELTVGTDEWNEKLKENNELVLSLLETYPELAKYVERTDNGQLTITQAGQNAAKQAAEARENAARNAAYTAQIAFNQAKLRNDETNTGREIGLSTKAIDTLSRYMIENNKSSAELTPDDIHKAFQGLGWDRPAVVDVLNTIKENGATLDIIANKVSTTDTSNRLYFDEVMKDKLGDEYNENSPYNDALFEEYDSFRQMRESMLQGLGAGELLKRYAEYAGLDAATVREQDFGANAVIKTPTGDVTYTKEELVRDLAAEEAINRVLEKNTDAQTKLNEQTEKYGEELGKILRLTENGKFEAFDFSGMTQSEVNTLLENLKELDPNTLDHYGSELGLGMGPAAGEALLTELENYIKQNPSKLKWEDIAPELSRNEEDIQKILENAGLTEEQLDDYIQIFENNYGSGIIDDERLTKEVHTLSEIKQELTDNIKKTEDSIKAKKKLGLSVEKETQQLESYKSELDEANNRIKELAIDSLETANGVKTLSDNWEDWNKKLNSGNAGDIAQAQSGLKDSLSQILNVDSQFLSSDVLSPAVLEQLSGIAQGTITDINALRAAASEPIIAEIKTKVEEKAGPEIWAQMENIVNYAQNALPDIEVGAELDLSKWYPQLQNLLASGAMTANQMNAIFETIGFDMEVEEKEVPFQTWVAEMTSNIDTSNPFAGALQGVAVSGAVFQATKSGAITWKNGTPSKVKVTSLKAVKKGSGTGYSGGGSGGSGGGGGGGGGSKSTGSKKDVPTNEKDIYEKVNTTLNKIESDMSDLNRQQDNLAEGGIRWLAVLETEQDTLQQQVKTLQEKRKIQESEKDSYATQLTKIAKQVGVNTENLFDDNGQYKGYSATWDAINRKIQAAYNAYNAVAESKTPEDLKPLEDEITKWEKVLQDFDKAYQGFDQLYSTDIPATIESIREAEDAIGDLGESIFKAKRESAKSVDEWIKDFNELNKSIKNVTGQHIKIDFEFNKNEWNRLTKGANDYINTIIKKYQDLRKTADKTQKAWLNAQIKLLEDVKSNGKSSLLNYVQQQIADVENLWNQYNKTGSYTITDANGKTYKSTDENFLREISESAMEDAQNIASQLGDVLKNQLEGLNTLVEDMNDNLDDTMDKYDTMSEQIDHIQEMYELFNGDKPDQSIVDAYNQQAASEEKRLYALEQSKTYYSQITKQYKELLALDPKNLDYQKVLREAQEKEREIDSQILDTRKEIVEKYKEARDEANKLALANWSNLFKGNIDMGDGTSVSIPLKEAADQWERIKEQEAFYLDDLNKAAEIQKLQNKYQDLLNNATDPMIQKQITEQMKEQLEYLREKDKLSEYDVKYANAQLEILQKTIALEDARAAKNTMKLRRDSQGNYQYVYAADQNDILNKQNDLLSANLDAYNMSKEHQNDVQGQMIDKIIDMVDKITSVMTNDELTAEEQDAEIRHIIDTNYYLLNGLYEQLGDSQKKMIDSFIKGGSLISDENSKGIADTIRDLLNGTLNNLDNVDETFTTFVKSWIGNDGKFIGEDILKGAANSIKNNLSDYETRTDDWAKEIKDATTAVTQMTNATSDLIKNLKTNVKEFETQNTSLKEWTETLTEANNVLQKMLDKLGSSSIVGSSYVGDTAAGLGKKPDKEGSILGNLTTNPPSATNVVRKGSTIKYNKDGKKYKVLEIDKNRTNKDGQYKIDTKPNPSWVTIDKIKVLQYKTGGYTGFWNGPDIEENGRLAFLHQKELVLNSTDTQNILAAVDAVRNITNRLKITNFANSMATIGKVAQNAINGNNIRQRVEITANFPSVTSSKEIENALLNLSDTAYQYAYNKNNIPW